MSYDCGLFQKNLKKDCYNLLITYTYMHVYRL